MVVMEDVTEEVRSAELYVSVHGGGNHGGLDHTFLKRGGEGDLSPFLLLSEDILLAPEVLQ